MIVTYTIIWLASSFGLCLFGFLLGRCARRLPIIDSRLPWTLSRDQSTRAYEKGQQACEHMPGTPSWPEKPE